MLEIAIEIIAIMFCISGIIFGIGEIFDNEKLKNFAKLEVLETFFNSFLVASAFLLFGNNGIVQRIVNEIANTSQQNCPSSISYNYASCFAYSFLVGDHYFLNGKSYPSLANQIISMLLSIVFINGILGLISGFSILIFNFSKVFSSVFSILSILSSSLSISLISITAQSYLILFVTSIGPSILLPISLILRSFIATKKLGSALFAFFVSFCYILPLTYFMNALFFEDTSLNIDLSELNQTIEVPTNSTTNSSIIQNGEEMINQFKDYFSKIFSKTFEFVGYLLIKSIFIPAFSLSLAWLSTREISQLLGNEIPFKVNVI
jgi:hypothetical protein